MKNEIINDTQPKAVIYCRVSTKEQVDEGNSLISQERLCREYALKEGYKIVEVFIEKGESAKTAKRKELLRMLDLCNKNKGMIQAVIAYKVDRISRNLADYSAIKIKLKKAGAEIKSATELFEDTPAGRFMENIIANVSQFDNEVRTERSVGGMREAMQEGRYVWKAPLGYDNAKVNNKATIVPNAMAPLIKEVFELIARREYSTEIVRLQMHEKGLTDRKGRPICKSYFFRLIRNPAYKGVIKKFGNTNKGCYEAIISEALFDDVQAALKGRTKKIIRYAKENPDFPLRGFVQNGNGKTLLGYWAKGKRLKYPYYSFNEPKTTIRKEKLEDKFIKILSEIQFSVTHLNALKIHLIKHFEANIEKEGLAISTIENRINDVNQQIDVIIGLRGQNSISETIFTERMVRLENELSGLKGSLHRIKGKEATIPDLLNFTKKTLQDLASFWQRCPLEIQRKLQVFVFPQGVIFDGEELRTPKIRSVFRLKLLIDTIKFSKVPSGESGKNTVYGTNISASDKKLLNDKAFWQDVVSDLQELKDIMEPKPAPEAEEEKDPFDTRPPGKWWWDKAA